MDAPKRRTALYFAGRIKTYEDQLNELLALKNKYNMDMFCSINGEEDEVHTKFLSDLGIVRSFFEDHATVYNPEWARQFHRLPTQSDRDAYKLSSSLYHNHMAMKLVETYQQEQGFVYDTVIKYRADIISKDIVPIMDHPLPNVVYIPEGYDWHFYDQQGINDHIAYGSFEVMKIYSNVFANVEKYCRGEGHGYHPESLLLYHLQSENIDIHRFPFGYTHNTNRHEPGEYG